LQSSQVKLKNMSKSNRTRAIPEEKITEAFEEALAKDAITDVIGNKIKKEEIEITQDYLKAYGLPKDKLSVGRILPIIRNLQGKVLTIIDATYDDKERGKYVKDLVKDAFSSTGDWVYELATIDIEEEK
jgi:hypothetical protein